MSSLAVRLCKIAHMALRGRVTIDLLQVDRDLAGAWLHSRDFGQLGAGRPRDGNAGTMYAGGRPIKVTWLTITDVGRQALAGT
jgi:hypothetical protein